MISDFVENNSRKIKNDDYNFEKIVKSLLTIDEKLRELGIIK